MNNERYQSLMDRSLQCIHRAREINDRYTDNPVGITADEHQQRKSLLQEATRLRDLAETEKQQDELETWAQSPGDTHPALATKARHDAAAAANADGEMYTEANKRLHIQQFAKALKLGKDSLNTEEKAAIIENSTGQIIVPHDLAGPIFLQLPRLGVVRDLALVRPTTSNLVDVRALTGVTAGWGQVEITNAGGATPPTDAGIAATGPNTVTVQDLVALVQIGVDELMDTDANLVSLVQEIVGQKFAEMEDDAFAAGNGTSKPFGVATRATIGGAIPAAQGVTAAASAVIVPDDLKKLQYVILARFANVGSYIGSDAATQQISLLKDSTSNYLWQPSNQAGQPDRLFGRAYYRVTGLPAPGSAPAVLFGDIRSGYLIADRQRITVQRLDERYADQGLVGFLFRERVGGDVIRPAAFAKYLV
jgi:HK97 family phage major capsid protein